MVTYYNTENGKHRMMIIKYCLEILNVTKLMNDTVTFLKDQLHDHNHMTCEVHRTSHWDESQAWFNALLLFCHLEILNTFEQETLHFIWNFKLSSQTSRKYELTHLIYIYLLSWGTEYNNCLISYLYYSCAWC